MRLTNTNEPLSAEETSPEMHDEPKTIDNLSSHPDEGTLDLYDEAVQQIEQEQGVKLEVQQELQQNGHGATSRATKGFRKFIESGKAKKTPRLLLQIWQSDFSIVAFVLVMVTFYLMKDTRYPPIGLLFFLLAMATVDAILSIFVVRLSFHQNKHGFYRTEDFQRDWLRYRMLLSMTKAALLFVVGTSCGTTAVIASYVIWFFTSTQRLRYLILRWSMDDHYPELQRWSIFALLREAGIEPKLRNFNLVAALGVLIGFAIVFVF